MSDDGAAPAPTPDAGAAGILSQTQSAAEQAATTPAPPVDVSDKWYNNIAEDHHGFIENKGWQSPDALLESYVNLEKMRGIPEDQLVRLPSAEDTDGWKEVYNRLGRPESPDGYTIDGLEEGEFGSWYKNTMHEAGLTQQQAEQVAKQYDSFAQEQSQIADEKYQQQAAVDMDALRNEWGADADANFQMAARGATFLGLDKDQMAAIEKEVGTKTLLTMALKAGQKLSEGEFITGGSLQQNARPTQAEAKAKYDQLVTDPDFRSKLMSQDKKVRDAAMAERTRLSKLAYDS